MSAAYIPGSAADPAAIPDPDRPHPPGLTWYVPLLPRPILIGPSEDHPDVHPALALNADQFWSSVHHGLRVGRARVALDLAAVQYALSASLDRARTEVADLADAAEAWATAVQEYTLEIT